MKRAYLYIASLCTLASSKLQSSSLLSFFFFDSTIPLFMFCYSLSPFSFLWLNALRPFKLTSQTSPSGLTFLDLRDSRCSPLECLHLLETASILFPNIGQAAYIGAKSTLWQVANDLLLNTWCLVSSFVVFIIWGSSDHELDRGLVSWAPSPPHYYVSLHV